jgi:hypothetical protein
MSERVSSASETSLIDVHLLEGVFYDAAELIGIGGGHRVRNMAEGVGSAAFLPEKGTGKVENFASLCLGQRLNQVTDILVFRTHLSQIVAEPRP